MPVTSLHLTNAWHSTSGGIRTFYSALLDAADGHGRNVVVVVPGARDGVRHVGRHGRLYTIASPHAPAFDRRYRILYPHRYWPGIGRSISRILEKERPDVVEICDKYSLPYFAAMLRKHWFPRVPRPTLIGLSCERFDDNMAAYLSRADVARRFTQWYIRNIYGPPFDVHLANSVYTADELRAALHDRPQGFIRVCPMGVDIREFGPERRTAVVRERLLQQAGGSSNAVLVLYAGRLSPEKNLELLIAAMRRLVTDSTVDYRLVVAGDGPRAEWLREQSGDALAGRILVCGNLDRRTLAECYASCDVFVHPNPREPFGIGPLEAMASGLPVVVPDAGGVLTYANTMNSWIARPTPGAFATAIRAAAFGNPARLAAARATARQFGWDCAAARFFALYDGLHLQRTVAESDRDADAVTRGPLPSAGQLSASP